MSKALELLGYTNGELSVVGREGTNRHGQTTWLAKCSCGNTTIVIGTQLLREGRPKSCGCAAAAQTGAANTLHGMSGTSEYRIWKGILQRCGNPKNPAYPDYGGRGIAVCDRWNPAFTKEAFQNFSEDMGLRPESSSIERVDNALGYSPDNCVWADRSTQGFNQRLSSRNTSGYKGVHFYKRDNNWIAQITKDGKRHSLGYFEEIEDAIAARKEAEERYYPKTIKEDNYECKS